jgi:hypothetical protein
VRRFINDEIFGPSNSKSGEVRCPPFSFTNHPKFRKLELRVVGCANTELVATWLSETLSTITSAEFKELTIYIARVSFSFHIASDNQVRGWNAVDNVLDRLSLCEDVTLLVRPQHWTIDDRFKGLIEKYFPLMWENERVVLEGPPLQLEDGPIGENLSDRGFF